ncbi:angiopoietin-2 isoform X2 [Folsomia candida]|uniref:angiopoietin-2 isoform X2 n=1 Tax=Folsomia candida TaxID=158441 RepID=UPI00160547BF|nr:angiopoietin-2 isoform X2 [Folsomia candida]
MSSRFRGVCSTPFPSNCIRISITLFTLANFELPTSFRFTQDDQHSNLVMYISPRNFNRSLYLQIFFGGVVLQYLNLVQAADLNDELISRQNNLLERLSTQLFKIPTKDDLAALEAKFEQRIRILERRQTDDFKDQLQTISYAVNQKLEGLRTTIDNFPGIMKPIVDKEQKTHLEKKSREKRSLPAQPTTIVERELDSLNLSDYRLVLLTTQWLQNGFNNLTYQVAAVEKHQHEILKEIRNASSELSQGVGTILREVETLKQYTDNSPRGSNEEVVCRDSSNLTNSTFRNKQVICDKGWIVIQRRGTPTPAGEERIKFDKNWHAYEHGFGSLDSDFWLGLKTIHELTHDGYEELRVDLEDWEGEERYAMYANFKVADAGNKYRLEVAGYTGNAGDSLSYNSGAQFETIGRYGCASLFHGGWWYKGCTQAHLNSIYNNSSPMEEPQVGLFWSHWRGRGYSLKKVAMKIRKPSRII